MNNRLEAWLPLPQIPVPPKTVCLQIDVPDDPEHIAAMYGQLYQLTIWNAWDRDSLHTAKDVAAVWRKALNTLRTCSGTPIRPGMEIEDAMPLRVDCNCDVYVTCCDGTEKQILTSDQVKALINNSVQGATQPGPTQCAQYNLAVTGAQGQIVPTPMSTGDTIQVVSAQGASTSTPTIGTWWCPDGREFFAGQCITGTSGTDPGNLVPTAPNGSLVILFGSSYYSLASTFTVPAGVANVQPIIFLNYASDDNPQGTVNVTVEVCNHQTPTWTHAFDFTRTNGGMAVDPSEPSGAWVSGTGWNTTLYHGHSDIVIGRTFDSRTVTHIDFTWHYSGSGADGDQGVGAFNGFPPGTLIREDFDISVQRYAWDGSLTMAGITFGLNGGGSDVSTHTMLTLTLSGEGSDPFAL